MTLLKLTIIQRKSLNKFLVHKNIQFSLYNRHNHFYSSISYPYQTYWYAYVVSDYAWSK